MTCLVALLPSALALLTQRPFMNLLWSKFYLPRGLIRGPPNLTSTYSFLPSLLAAFFHDTLHDRGDSEYLTGKFFLSFLWWSLCGPLSPCEASSQAHLAPGYFSAMICLGSVLCLVLLAFNSNANFLRMVFSSYRVQIKMPAANDNSHHPLKEMPKIPIRPDRPDLLITYLTLGKFFTSYEGSKPPSGAWSRIASGLHPCWNQARNPKYVVCGAILTESI